MQTRRHCSSSWLPAAHAMRVWHSTCACGGWFQVFHCVHVYPALCCRGLLSTGQVQDARSALLELLSGEHPEARRQTHGCIVETVLHAQDDELRRRLSHDAFVRVLQHALECPVSTEHSVRGLGWRQHHAPFMYHRLC